MKRLRCQLALGRRLGRALAGLAAAGLLAAGAASACDTPVYLYTLLQWGRDPYPVYYFHDGTEPAADAATNRYLQKMAAAPTGHANVALAKVNTGQLAPGDSGRYASRVWAKHRARQLPFHVVLTPRGDELFVGRLNLASAKGLVESPKRRTMAQQLSRGKHGLLLLLQGPNAQDNAAADEVVRTVVAAAAERDLDVGVLKVSRDDPNETWLVEQLLRLEPDLKEFDSPMVFGTFGRGHVLEPYLGRGIAKANLAELVDFMTGPCSCEVKTSDLGMDLLTDWDWDTHVAQLQEDLPGPVRWTLFDMADGPAGTAAEEATTARAPLTTGEQGGKPQDPGDKPAAGDPATAASGQTTRDGTATPAAAPQEPPGQAYDRQRLARRSPDGQSIRVDAAPRTAGEAGPSLGRVLGRRLAIGLGAALLVAAAVSGALMRRAKES